MATPAEVQTLADDSACVTACLSEKQLLALAVFLLWDQLNPGVPMTAAEVQTLSDESACIMACMSHKMLMAAMVQLLFEGGGGGGGGGASNGTTNMALAGLQPPTDGTVATKRVFDTDTGFSWYNSGTIASPTWNSV